MKAKIGIQLSSNPIVELLRTVGILFALGILLMFFNVTLTFNENVYSGSLGIYSIVIFWSIGALVLSSGFSDIKGKNRDTLYKINGDRYRIGHIEFSRNQIIDFERYVVGGFRLEYDFVIVSNENEKIIRKYRLREKKRENGKLERKNNIFRNSIEIELELKRLSEEIAERKIKEKNVEQ